MSQKSKIKQKSTKKLFSKLIIADPLPTSVVNKMACPVPEDNMVIDLRTGEAIKNGEINKLLDLPMYWKFEYVIRSLPKEGTAASIHRDIYTETDEWELLYIHANKARATHIWNLVQNIYLNFVKLELLIYDAKVTVSAISELEAKEYLQNPIQLPDVIDSYDKLHEPLDINYWYDSSNPNIDHGINQ